MNRQILGIIGISSICIMTAGASLFGTSSVINHPKPVLTADTNHDNALSSATVQAGQDFILVKPNPARLNKDDVVFQTKNYNLYTSASMLDLQSPEAVKKLLFARVTKDGTIKVYTLLNLGYESIQPAPNSNDIYLISHKGKTDKITQINLQPPTFHVYDPTIEKKAKAS